MAKYEVVGYDAYRMYEAIRSVGGRVLSKKTVWELHYPNEFGFGGSGRYRYHAVVEASTPIPEFWGQYCPPELLSE